ETSLPAHVLLGQAVTADDLPRIANADRHAEVSQRSRLEAGGKMLQGLDREQSLSAAFDLAAGEVVHIGAVVLEHVDHVEVGGFAPVVDQAPGPADALEATGNDPRRPALIARRL